MTTLTDKELIKEIKERIGSLDVRDNIERRAYEIALASLEAKPIGAFHIAEQQVDGTSDYIKDGEWPINYLPTEKILAWRAWKAGANVMAGAFEKRGDL